MKAIVLETYGPPDVLHLEDVPLPAVRDGDVLVKVRAASANAGDWHLLRGTPLPVRLVAGLRKPKFTIIGNDIAGVITDRTGVQDGIQINDIIAVIDHRRSSVSPFVWDSIGTGPGAPRRSLKSCEVINGYAAFASSCCTLSAAPLIAMRRGFMASGISRTSSIFSKPLSKAALFTCT